MKRTMILTLGALLVCGAVYAAQKTEFSQRDVRDPRRLAVFLENNATDAETRLSRLAAGQVTHASATVTNAQAVTLSATVNLLTSAGQANAETNTITLANPVTIGRVAYIHNVAASTNILAVAKTGNFEGPALNLTAGETAVLISTATNRWAGIGQ